MGVNTAKWAVLQERRYMRPLMVLSIITSFVENVDKVLGRNYSAELATYDNGICRYCLPAKEYDEIAVLCLEKIRKDSKFVRKLIEKFDSESRKFLKFTKSIYEQDLSKKTNAELYEYFHKYYKKYLDLYPFGEPFPFAIRLLLDDVLMTYLKKQLAEKKIEKQFSHYLTVLAVPPTASFAWHELQDFLKIAILAKKKGRIDAELDSLIEKHTAKYNWVPFDYEGPAWDREYFLKVFAKLLGEKEDLEERLEKNEKYLAGLKTQQKKVFAELGIDDRHKKLFYALQDCTQLMDLKKERFTQAHYHITKLVEEIAERLSVSMKQAKFLLLDELKDALLNNNIDAELLSERNRYCAWLTTSGTGQIFVGEKAKKLMHEVEEISGEGMQEIQGMAACPGTVIGIARLLLTPENLEKIHKGEILVTGMTTPDYAPAIHKAAAIITNEGGTTCHAAIISREFGIPCIVGTKIATKVLHDGDLIEVHGANGIVKILKRVQND